jgi:hypothetical protein
MSAKYKLLNNKIGIKIIKTNLLACSKNPSLKK